MGINEDGTMSGCLFNGRTEICDMAFFEHISIWQGIFSATQNTDFINLLSLIILLSVSIATATTNQNLASLLRLFNTRKLYILKSLNLHFNYLKKAFSQGILEPKIYELVIF